MQRPVYLVCLCFLFTPFMLVVAQAELIFEEKRRQRLEEALFNANLQVAAEKDPPVEQVDLNHRLDYRLTFRCCMRFTKCTKDKRRLVDLETADGT